MITVLIWKMAFIGLFIKKLDIMLSEFCPDICPWADIAVALPVFTHETNECHFPYQNCYHPSTDIDHPYP
jgi:hypothetical protein